MDVNMELQGLQRAFAERSSIVCVHYACGNFFETKGQPANVYCIALHFPGEDTTKAILISNMPGETDDEREIALLKEFYKVLQQHSGALLIHWNMNSADYGFDAILSRYRVLTGEAPSYTPTSDKQLDLDSLIAEKFGDVYAAHPKLPNLSKLNEKGQRFYLKGADELEKATSGDFGAVQRSCAEKVKTIAFLARRLADGTLRTLGSAGAVEFAQSRLDAVQVVLELGHKFRNVERSLKRRHDNRPTLIVENEYDSQDLFRSMLVIFFDDVSEEHVTPEYAGGSARIDFMLRDFQVAVELKYARESMSARKLSDELIVDRDRYSALPGVTHLVCLVFDHDGLIPNPRGLEKDLGHTSSVEGLAVTVRIFDR